MFRQARNVGLLLSVNKKISESKLCCPALILAVRNNRSKSYTNFATSRTFSSPFDVQRTCMRYKSKKQKQDLEEIKENELSDDEYQEGFGDTYDDDEGKEIRVKSLRIDRILKSCTGLKTKDIEEAILSGKVKINGSCVEKRSVEVRIGDEIEVVKEYNDKLVKKYTIVNYKLQNLNFYVKIQSEEREILDQTM